MKIKKIFIGTLISLFVFSLYGIATKALNHPSEYFNPIYYDLKAPSDYYADVDTSLTGESFRNNLFLTISNGHTPVKYHDNNEIIRYTDPDPLQVKPGNVIGLYSGKSLAVREKDWNKEHVWAKSHGFSDQNALPHGDSHHLRPAIPTINSKRSNHDFGEVNAKADAYGNKFDGRVFEPRDEAKGDVARMMFYMATRYGAMTSFNLRLVESRTTGGSSASFGGLKDLIKWHYNDPVSKEEIYRNNIIFEFYQHNRNPYIDHPEWVDLAYPSEYANQEVDMTKVNQVIKSIEALPLEITLGAKDLVNSANDLYAKLNYAERLKVTNYKKLLAAINTINNLENIKPDVKPEPDKPIIPDDSAVVIDLAKTNLSDHSYQSQERFKVGNYDFYASNLMINNGGIRLGSNNNLPLSILGLDASGAYLDINQDFTNIKSISIDILNTYSGYKGWKLYFKEANSNTYSLINSGADNRAIATLDEAKNGHFVLAIIGTKARADLGEYKVYLAKEDKPKPEPTTDPSVKSFIQEKTNNSLKVKVTETLFDADLRIGSRIKKESFKAEAKYGVLVLEGNQDLKAGLQDTKALKDFGLNNYLEIKPVRVNDEGIKDDNGEYYQFAWVITNMENHYDSLLTGVIYMELEGKLYFSNPVFTSLINTTSFYLGNNLVSDPIIKKALEDLLQ